MAANGIDVIANVKLYDLDAALATQDPVVPTKTVLAISGTTKDDIVTVNANADMELTINTGEGNDTVRGASSKAGILVNTGTGKDWVDGSAYNDDIRLGEGNDTTYSGAGNDAIDGGAGSDYLSAGEGNDKVTGGIGRDYLEGSRGNDELWGNDTSNVDDNERDMFIYRLDRTLKNSQVNFGLEWGNDTIHDFHAHTTDKKGDLIEMDDFFMRLSDVDVKKILDAVDNAVKVNSDGKFTDANGKVFHAETLNEDGDGNGDAYLSQSLTKGSLGQVDKDATNETIYDVNGLDGGKYQVKVAANWDEQTNHVSMKLTFTNSMSADDKGASITIKNADDLNAIASFDRETMKLVHGTNDAQKGDIFDLNSDAFNAALGGKGAYFYGFAGNDKVLGTLKDDNLGGGDGNDIISGGDGNDRVYGDAGNDTLHGGAGNDYLSGGAGFDTLYGADGKDTLWGGAGTNFLTGGADKDIFYINGSGLTFDTKDGHAIAKLESTKTVITDFELLVDKIKLGDIFADYRISNTNAQNAKYAEWVKSHVEFREHIDIVNVEGMTMDEMNMYGGYGNRDLVIHLNTIEDDNNVLVISHNDNFDAQTVYESLKAGNMQSMMDLFVFG